MITIEESIPTKSNSYRIAEEIFYLQFNDISIFVEDEEQENFYYCIFKKLFPNIKIEKIFPLKGKDNVIAESYNNLGNKKKIFLVDLDFDDLLSKMVSNPNLFYLQRYSIENFLIEKEAIVDYIISERPRLKKQQVNYDFDINLCIEKIGVALKDIVYFHIVVQNICPQLKNISLNHERFFTFNDRSFDIRLDQIQNYATNIELELNNTDRRLRLNSQLQKANRLVRIETYDQFLKHMPGKYLIKMLKQFIESLFGLSSRNIDSFCYRLAEKCSFRSLEPLKLEVQAYIQ